jgi:DNA-directed RNA polymerase subunit RPC12/RpoP
MGVNEVAGGQPSVRCPECGASVPLNAVMEYGYERIMVCPACRHRMTWRIGSDDSRDQRPTGRP